MMCEAGKERSWAPGVGVARPWEQAGWATRPKERKENFPFLFFHKFPKPFELDFEPFLLSFETSRQYKNKCSSMYA
jgi:hypothetical protein